jgi:subtilisin family serine protease
MSTGIIQKRPVLVILFAFLFWGSFQFINPVYANVNPSNQVVMIQFEQGVSEAERIQLIEQMGGELVTWMAPIDTAIVNLQAANQRNISRAMQELASVPQVVMAEYDAQTSPILAEAPGRTAYATQSTIPPTPVQVNDPDFNNPQRVYAPSLIQLTTGWGYSMGQSNVVVAVVDSGVNAQHPDLQGRILPGYDFVNNDNDPDDDHGHGTHVAGIIAANANNGIGSAGVCPNCSILPVKVLNSSNVGTWSDVVQGIIYAVEQNAGVINLSLGGTSDIQTVRNAVNYAVENNVIVVAAAGNSRSDVPFFPAAIEEVIAVSATRNDDTIWSLSNYGDYIDVAAPGFAVYSTFADLNNYYGGYTFMSGTSMAAPHVAGLVGLIRSQQPDRTLAEIRQLISENATDLGDPGRDIYFGNGRIDVGASLAAGAPQPQATAQLGGTVWHDENTDGQWNGDETIEQESVTIQVYDAAGNMVSGTTVQEGEWQISSLYPGRYEVRATTSARLVFTSTNVYIVNLQEGQRIDNLNFGLAQIDQAAQIHAVFLPAVVGN